MAGNTKECLFGGIELIEFLRPSRNEQNLFITNINGGSTKELVYEKLHKIFSRFGLIYEVQVFASDDQQDIKTSSSFIYAFVKFYSTVAAAKARQKTNSKWYFDGQLIKVQFASRKKTVDDVAPLYSARCRDLANYYFGFNGWTTNILKFEECVDSSFLYSCVVKLTVLDCHCYGVGYGGNKAVREQEKDLAKKLEHAGFAKKAAHERAVEDAFSKTIIVVLGNGKVGIEIKPQVDENLISFEEDFDCEEKSYVRVNFIPETPDEESIDENMEEDEIQNG